MMSLQLKRKGETPVVALQEKAGVPYMTFPALKATGVVIHGFSTRLGGVSRGDCATMNFAQGRGDDPANIRENYRRMAVALGFAPEKMVLSYQTHTTNIRKVTIEDLGKGYDRERDYRDIDGLITDVPGAVLVTSYADCVPLLFVDPVRKAIGASHSGWRGTAGKISHHVISAMEKEFGSKREDILACIGPSICGDCYEVSEDVANVFMAEAFAGAKAVTPGNREGKFQLDLWAVNHFLLKEAGILDEHINVTDVCTCCNSDYLFSHRKSEGKRGNLGAFLMLRKS